MPTREAYRDRLHPLLTQGLEPGQLEAPAGQTPVTIDDLADRLGGVLEELERQHMGAHAHLTALLAQEPAEPWEGDGELAFMLYYLHNPPEDLQQEIARIPGLSTVWSVMAAAAPPSPFSPQQLLGLQTSLPKGAKVYCNQWGDIYGFGTYEQLDPGWAWTLKNTVMNHLPRWWGHGAGIANFVPAASFKPVPLVPLNSGCDSINIAIIGDWGTGKFKMEGLPGDDGPACAVMETIKNLPDHLQPDYLIHLGDTYYSGTGPLRSPANEEKTNLVDMLKLYPDVARPQRCFTLNSNHEMYGGAKGYYGQALSHNLFAQQYGCSYFALEFGDWMIVGLDSAYYDPSNLYMDGGLGSNKDPQYDFLHQVKRSGKKVILMSHHTGMSNDGAGPSKYLWDDVTSVLVPDYWYWGHVHLGAVYNSKSFAGGTHCRCIGHGAIPFASPPGMVGLDTVDWYSSAALISDPAEDALLSSSYRAKNGFALITLSKDGISEAVYNIGDSSPAWST